MFQSIIHYLIFINMKIVNDDGKNDILRSVSFLENLLYASKKVSLKVRIAKGEHQNMEILSIMTKG